METSIRAPLNGHTSRTFKFKGLNLNWVSVPGGRTLTPDVLVRSYVLAFDHGT